MNKIIDIIGAGIAGLTLAIALKRKGIGVRVFEQAPELKAVGAGINLACNAMQVYEHLGLRLALEEVGHICHQMQVTDHQLSPLSVVDIKPFTARYGVHNVAIHRAALQSVLRSELAAEEVFLDKQLSKVEELESGLILYFADGSAYESECLIGADGIHSQVRQTYFQAGSLRMADQICWRGVANFQLPNPYYDQLTEAWGKTGRFGFVQVDAERVYWFAVMRNKQDTDGSFKSFLLDTYSDFAPLVGELLSATPVEHIHEAPLGDLQAPASWYKGAACLIGDAAHATTPNLGQGACQAIEDAWILSNCLAQETTITEAFQRFQSIREPKVNQIVKTSWTVGQMAHWNNPLAIGFRNTLMRMMPKRLGEKQSERIYTLEMV